MILDNGEELTTTLLLIVRQVMMVDNGLRGKQLPENPL